MTATKKIDLREVGARAWLVVGLLWPVALLNYLDRLMLTTMREPIRESIPMTEAQFGLLTAVFLWVYAVLSPAAGYVTDRFSRRMVIVGSLGVWSGVTWLTAHAQSFSEMLTARALMGVSEACYIPAALALIADYHPRSTRSLATGLHMSGLYAGMALGGLGGYVAEWFDWHWAFTACGAFGVVYAVLLALCLRDADTVSGYAPDAPPAEPITISYALSGLFGQPAFWLLLLANAMFGYANWVINGWLPTYLQEHFSLGLGEAGMRATLFTQAASFAGVVSGGIWADRWYRRNVRGRALVAAIGLASAAPCLSMAISTEVLPIAALGLIIYGLGRGFYDANLMPVLRQVTDQRLSATGYAFLNVVSCATGGIMIYVGGRLKDVNINLSYVFQASAAALLVGAVALCLVRPKPDSGAK